MTLSPSRTSFAFPNGTVGRRVAFTLRTARSRSWSAPITRAPNDRLSGAGMVTLMLSAPSTTWKFVTIIPSDLTTNPVPTPLPVWPPTIESGFGTAVVTFALVGDARSTTETMGSAVPEVLSELADGRGGAGVEGETPVFFPASPPVHAA